MKNILLLIVGCLLSPVLFAQEKNTVYAIDVHFKITDVREGKGDTLWLSLEGGSGIGIEKGSKGAAVRVYKGKEREYKVLDPAFVVKVSPGTSLAYVLVTGENKSKYLVPGDQVAFPKLPVPAFGKEDNSLLRSLASFNIRFADQSSVPFYWQQALLKEASNRKFDSLLYAFQRDIIETATYLREEVKEKPKSWTEPLTGGKFKGLGLLDALEKTSLLDVESFLHFVIEYPGKYLGNQWKINETYATWVLNDMPMATEKTYLVKSFARLPQAAIASWAKENNFYYDSLKHYLITTIDRQVTDHKIDSAEVMLAKAQALSEAKRDQKFLSVVYTSKAQLLQQKEAQDHTAAISLYTKAIELDSMNWAPYWYRGNLYGEMEQYNAAIKDMKVLNRLYPFYASAWGNQGWWYLKQFKVKEAGPHCLKAYELDSASSSWAVNLAHYYLLTGQHQKARAAYQKTLENLKSEGEFIHGPLTDFDFFAERGVLNEVFTQEKNWMLEQFNKTYKHYLQADSLFQLAKTYRTKKEYAQAAQLFIKSRDAENAASIKRQLYIHNITTWIGYMYLQLKDYGKAEAYYTEALATAQKDFPRQVAIDLELMSELYQQKGNKALADAYQSQAIGWKNRPSGERSGDLYLVSIGVDKYADVNYDWAAADAQSVASSLKKAVGFTHVFPFVLTNNGAVSDSVDKTMQRIIASAKEDDTFIFYFTGKALSNDNESFLVPYGLKENTDSVLLKKGISAQLLRSWSNSINARHQFFLLDAAASNFTSAFANQSSSFSKAVQQKDLLILCANFPRIENQEAKSSLIAASLVKFFQDAESGAGKMITGKQLENHFASELTRNNYYLSLESYSQGRDFVLAGSKTKAQPERSSNYHEVTSVNLRGTAVENVSQSGSLSLNKRYGLFIATDNYADPKWSKLNNPISDATELKKTLEEEYGFEIEILANPTKSEIFHKIDEYSKKKFDKNDQLVILFAGHGYYDARRNEGYLVPSDAAYTDIEFDRYYYPMSSIMRDLRIIPAQHMMVLVDACHGGAICDNALMRGDGDLYDNLSLEQLVRNHLEYPNRLIVTSGRKDQRVPDGVKGKNSPFIAAILNALRSNEAKQKGMISYYQLMKYISDVQKTQATSAIFSPNDNWNFMFFYGGNKKKSPIADPAGRGGD